jgi:hypothetical protein
LLVEDAWAREPGLVIKTRGRRKCYGLPFDSGRSQRDNLLPVNVLAIERDAVCFIANTQPKSMSVILDEIMAQIKP